MDTEKLAGCVAALLTGPRTVPELCETTGLSRVTIDRWLNALREAGVARVGGRPGTPGGGRAPIVYAMQPSPFGLPDAPMSDDTVKRKARAFRLANAREHASSARPFNESTTPEPACLIS